MRTCAVALLATLWIAGSALAATGNSIQISAPGPVKQHAAYNVTIHGFAVGRATAYVFIDYAGCATSFAIEKRRAPSYAYPVTGSFSEVSGWSSSSSGVDRACAYLVTAKSPNPLASARVSFQIH